MRGGSLALGVAMLLASVGLGAGLEGAGERAGYSLGHQIGSDLAREGRSVDLEALRQGLRDGLSGAEPARPREELRQRLAAFKGSLDARDRGGRFERGLRLRREGAAFLAANAARPGVVSLPSGLQYRVIEPGHGRSPGPEDRVRVHYRATLIDGTPFHDSRDSRGKPDNRDDPDNRQGGGEPETLAVGGVIPGLGEALQHMREGARFEIFIPADLAYGRRGPLEDRAVIYDVELLAIEEQP